MATAPGLWKDERAILAALAIVYLLTRLPLLTYLPLIKDEGVYSVMIAEQHLNPTIIPTFFGYMVNWKPPLFFWAYSAVSMPLFDAGLPLEAAFRLPSFIFGLATIPVLYGIFKNLKISREAASLSLLIFLLSYPTLYPDAALLLDSLNFFLISCSLYLYTSDDSSAPARASGSWRFAAAGALAFAAFFTKLVIAFMAPVLAVVYAFTASRKNLRDPLFLASLLAVPLAYLLNAQILAAAGFSGDPYHSAFGEHTAIRDGLGQALNALIGSMEILFLGAGLWLALSLFGFWKHWRQNKFMAAWYALTVVPLFGGNFMVWYYLPVMPAIAYFATMLLIRWDGTDRLDSFFAIFFAMLALTTLVLIAGLYDATYKAYSSERDAGNFLVGKPGVEIVGYYSPGLLAYKTLGDLKATGAEPDFGWITGARAPENESVIEYVRDYHSGRFNITDGTFNKLFNTLGMFRKDTNITDFRYVAIVGDYNIAVPGSGMVFNTTGIRVFEVSG